MTKSIPYHRFARPDQVATVHESIVVGEDGRPYRAIQVSVFKGLSIRVLPDRGLDISEAWFGGAPVHWAGWAQEGPPGTRLDGQEWAKQFFGGLVTTCGLASVGEPSEGHGLHGRINHQPASEVAVETIVGEEGTTVRITGVVMETTLDGGLFELRRTIEVKTGSGSLELVDVTRNLADRRLPAPILYHLNFGWPLISDDCVVEIADHASAEALFGDPSELPGGWQRPGMERKTPGAVTFEHSLKAGKKWGSVRAASPSAEMALTLSWDRETMPRLVQWINCSPAQGVVAFEPGNCGPRGRAHERAANTLPTLDAGETRTTRLRMDFERLLPQR